MIYVPKWFALNELIPKSAVETIPPSKAWFIFDNRLLLVADYLRRDYGRMIVNDWKWGGKNQYRGWRPFNTEIGASLSQHKFGRALDIIPQDASVDEIRNDIINRKRPYMEIIKGIEMEVNWLHIDTRNYESPDILQFYPS